MRSYVAAIAAALMFAAGRLPAFADAAPDFGQPPSGEVPILYNDHHVYAKPDILRQERVLAALVKGNTIYVPLRSMFEQMGATVSASAGGKTVTAKKTGVTVAVTLGKNEVVINGESRPLDVPPILYKGVVLVPVRVISEALGAYVQWVPSQRVVVVRYLPPTPVPTAPPTIAPTPPPTPAATPTPTPAPPAPPSYLGFIQGGYTRGKIYNEFAAGQNAVSPSYVAAGAYLLDPFEVKFDMRQDSYNTTQNCTFTPVIGVAVLPTCGILRQYATGTSLTCFSTIDGGRDCTRPFKATQTTADIRVGYKVADPHVYIGAGYLVASNNYGYPRLSGLGFGVEKLPDFTSTFGFFASTFYYPSASGNYTVTDPTSPNFGVSYKQQYRIVKYDVGADLVLGNSPFYLYGGVSGDQFTVKSNAPVNQTHNGPYLGLGVRF